MNESEKKELLDFAYDVLKGLFTGKRVDIPTCNESFGAFVTLRKKGSLRGCIGYMEPVAPLYRMISLLVKDAAFNDFRFPPLDESEVNDVSIEISLLLMKFSVTRLDTVYQTFYTALANVCITAVFHFIQGRELIYLFSEIVAITLNVTVTYIIISILLPLMEHFLNIPTVFRLHELSSTDSPILIRLRTQAIGTYNHVLNVSNMAYNAAKEIGANAELARVGALYHDIGKAEHPEYFIENQGGGPNVHDEMKYTLSAAVIKSHVKLGVEKGKEIGLPQEVLDIIDQHHGNDIIFYFYNKALEEAKESKTPIQVNEEDFRYTSDIPQSKEAGIVMLADCFEAATRSLKKPTTLRYEKAFTSILVGKMNASQLDDCRLSMSEIEKIKKVFVHQVFGRDHNRIQYTKEEND